MNHIPFPGDPGQAAKYRAKYCVAKNGCFVA